jgi:hypothetical protein
MERPTYKRHPLAIKLDFVGILEKRACHENTKTFDGAQPAHTLDNTEKLDPRKKMSKGITY